MIHTGQHYDYEMNNIFFDELGIPEPDYHLGVGSGSHGYQTGEILKRTDKEKIVKMANEFGPEGEQREVFGSGDASEKIMKIIVDLGERFYT